MNYHPRRLYTARHGQGFVVYPVKGNDNVVIVTYIIGGITGLRYIHHIDKNSKVVAHEIKVAY